MIILDGATGTVLQDTILKPGQLPELLNLKKPSILRELHKEYINAGADIVCANTFGANRLKLNKLGYNVKEIVSAGIKNASGLGAKVALDIGPIGQMLEPYGTLKFNEAYDIYKEIILSGKDANVIFFETFTDIYDLKAAVLAAKENSNKPIFTTMSFSQNGRTFTGCGVSEMALILEGLKVDALGFNCSLGPKEMYGLVKQLADITNLPIIVKPNAGLPDQYTGKFNVSAEEMTDSLYEIAQIGGVEYIGGCCGTTPAYIEKISEKLKKFILENPKNTKQLTVASGEKTITVGNPVVIGERLNPTGKKRFQDALRNRDIDYILTQALEQIEAGADILDVNVGMPDIDETEMMTTVIKALQSITNVPLQIDSNNPETIAAALRIYNGKPIVNSTTCEISALEKIIPIVAKYGANIVVLTIDENGIPKTAEERVAVSKKAIAFIENAGVPKENIIIDCLTLTASAEQDKVLETLKAVKIIKEMGYKTVLGISNISFGLPSRETVNAAFLSMALAYGLDFAIINPNLLGDTFRAYRVLANIDKNSAGYISSCQPQKQPIDTKNIDIYYAVANGLSNETSQLVKDLLINTSPLDIINEQLIPALDRIGQDFEKGIIFLPQLIMAATAAGKGFNEIEDYYYKKGEKPISKGTVVIATVKGDIHDIGKNIAKVLLNNYGYNVIDLGKDVEPQLVVNTVKKYAAKLVGLSALMTTTLPSMVQTIELLKAETDCKIMVGGAVITEDYAYSIGADYYAHDAKSGIDIAKKVYK